MKRYNLSGRKGRIAVLLAIALVAAGIKAYPVEAYAKTELSLKEPSREGKATVYDTVFFGEYPQTEIVTQALYDDGDYGEEAVCDDGLYEELSEADWEKTDDVRLDDVWYRRLSVSSDGGEEAFRYFRYDPIKWRVLCVEDIEFSDRSTKGVLLVSDRILDFAPYDETSENVWEDSSLRDFLNSTFAGRAFSDDEFKNDIIWVEEEASDGEFEAFMGENKGFTDDIFLLSGTEAFGEEAEDYGFLSSEDNTYGGVASDWARIALMTGYASALTGDGEHEEGLAAAWWLRSSEDESFAYIVDQEGDADSKLKEGSSGVRPALWIDIEAKGVSYAGELLAKEEENETDASDEKPEEEKKPLSEDEPEPEEKAEATEEHRGKYSEAVLYMSAEWFLDHIESEAFPDRAVTAIKVTEFEDTLSGNWLVYGRTDTDNPKNEVWDTDKEESFYQMAVYHMKADISHDDGYEMFFDSGDFFDAESGEIFTDGYKESMTGEETDDSVLFTGDVQIEVLKTFSLGDRFYAVGKLTYPSGETISLCMVREDIDPSSEDEADESEKPDASSSKGSEDKTVGTEEEKPEKEEDSSGNKEYTEEEIVELVRKLSGAPIADLDSKDPDGTLNIHCYEIVKESDGTEHTSTWDWYEVDPEAMTATDFFGKEHDLLKK